MSLPATASMPGLPGESRLTRQQKATIIVRLLQSEGIDLSLADLPDDIQLAIADEMSAMRYVKKSTLNDVVSEFVDELTELGLTFPRGVPGTLDAIEPSLSDTAAAQLRRAASGQGEDPWPHIAGLDVPEILELLEKESVEVCAVALSLIEVTKSAEIMGKLPGERARRIAYTMSRTNNISPKIVQKIGETLLQQIDDKPQSAFEIGPAERVGSILNYSRSATREDVLESLFEEDEPFAEAVRKAIFTYADIVHRIDARDVPKVVRAVMEEDLIKAVAASSDDSAALASTEFLLANMSQRVAGTIREEAVDLGKVKAKEGEEAMSAVVSGIRDLVGRGELLFIEKEDEDE